MNKNWFTKIIYAILSFLFEPIIDILKFNQEKQEAIYQNVLTLLSMITGKSILPMILTSRGTIINLAQERDICFDVIYDAQSKSVNYGLIVNHRKVDTYVVNLLKDDPEKEKHLYDYAQEILGRTALIIQRNGQPDVSVSEYYAVRATAVFMRCIQHREFLYPQDIASLCESSLLETTKAQYEKDHEKENKESGKCPAKK